MYQRKELDSSGLWAGALGNLSGFSLSCLSKPDDSILGDCLATLDEQLEGISCMTQRKKHHKHLWLPIKAYYQEWHARRISMPSHFLPRLTSIETLRSEVGDWNQRLLVTWFGAPWLSAYLFLLHRVTMVLPLVTCWLFRIAKNDDVFQGRWSLCERNFWRRQIWPQKTEAVKEHAFGLHVTWRQLLSRHRISPVELMDHPKTMWKPRKRRNWRSCMAGMVYWLRYSSYGRQETLHVDPLIESLECPKTSNCCN